MQTRDAVAATVWKIKHLYYRLYESDASIRIFRRNQEIANQLVRMAQERFASNLTPQQDVLKAQVEYAKIEDTLLRLERNRSAVAAELNTVIGRDPMTPIMTTEELFIPTEEIDQKQWMAEGVKNQPGLKVRAYEIEAAEASLVAERRSYVPDIDLGFAYRMRFNSPGDPIQGEDFFSLFFSVPIPIFAGAKQRESVQVARARLQSAQAAEAESRNQLALEIEQARLSLVEYRKRLSLLDQALLPPAKAAFENSRAAYKVGRIDFINVLTNQLSILQFELERVKTVASYARTGATLHYLLGRPTDVSSQGDSHE